MSAYVQRTDTQPNGYQMIYGQTLGQMTHYQMAANGYQMFNRQPNSQMVIKCSTGDRHKAKWLSNVPWTNTGPVVDDTLPNGYQMILRQMTRHMHANGYPMFNIQTNSQMVIECLMD